MRHTVQSKGGARVSYSRKGSGPPLLLVHGGFSDDVTNWEFVQPLLQRQFTVYAVARRGRNGTDATEGHSLEQEVLDVLAVMEEIREQVFLLGHSYGAQCALAAAAQAPERVRKLVLYEPPWPNTVPTAVYQRLEDFAASGQWDEMASAFFLDALRVPAPEIEALRSSDLWPPIVADAKASLQDLRALRRYEFVADRYRSLNMPVLLQTGSESPKDLYVTTALEAAIPDVQVEVLAGQAHEGMTTAPELYAESVARFLLGPLKS